MDHALDVKLPQQGPAGTPVIVKETLEDFTARGKDLIKALNENQMPIPEFYRDMLDINEWQTGMPVYLQKLPEEVSELPKEQNEQIAAFVEQYS